MRVFKPQYTKPLPVDATLFTPRTGKDKGIRFAKFTSKKGHVKTARLSKDGKKILCETKLWQIEFEDNLQIRRRLKAYTDETASRRLVERIQELLNFRANNEPYTEELRIFIEKMPSAIRAELVKFGVIDARRDTGKPLTEYIEDYIDHLTKRERCQRYISGVRETLVTTFAACRFVSFSDITQQGLRDYLDLKRDLGKGISKGRYNGILGHVKSFCVWMRKTGRAKDSPIQDMDGMDNMQTDSRHPRRVVDLNELRRFLEAARTSSETIYGLSGYERNPLYRLAIETGLRSIDLRRLRVKDIDFEGRKITIKAARIKNKTDADVYLKPATSAELQQYCKNKLPQAAVRTGTDGQNVTEERPTEKSLSKSFFLSGQNSTSVDNIGIQNGDSEEKTQLGPNNDGAIYNSIVLPNRLS